jgi:hypothetical protein
MIKRDAECGPVQVRWVQSQPIVELPVVTVRAEDWQARKHAAWMCIGQLGPNEVGNIASGGYPPAKHYEADIPGQRDQCCDDRAIERIKERGARSFAYALKLS